MVTLDSYSHPEYGAPAGKALAGLCFAVGDYDDHVDLDDNDAQVDLDEHGDHFDHTEYP